MIVLAALIHLPRKGILAFSLLLIFGHNLLDTIHYEGNVFWAILHEFAFFKSFSSIFRVNFLVFSFKMAPTSCQILTRHRKQAISSKIFQQAPHSAL